MNDSWDEAVFVQNALPPGLAATVVVEKSRLTPTLLRGFSRSSEWTNRFTEFYFSVVCKCRSWGSSQLHERSRGGGHRVTCGTGRNRTPRCV